jgi:hypothetical protein
MAHYAFLDENNFVVEVIVGQDETTPIQSHDSWEDFYSEKRGLRCLRTSYNGSIRKNYAGIGFIYNEELDAFIEPKPYPSWQLNKEKIEWEPPVPKPDNDFTYYWEESSLSWQIWDFSEPDQAIES